MQSLSDRTQRPLSEGPESIESRSNLANRLLGQVVKHDERTADGAVKLVSLPNNAASELSERSIGMDQGASEIDLGAYLGDGNGGSGHLNLRLTHQVDQLGRTVQDVGNVMRLKPVLCG